jgi:mRNA interferase HigB
MRKSNATMHVISRRKLREFWDVHPEAEPSLRKWHKTVVSSDWDSFVEARQTFPSVDRYQRCHIFNVGGNKYRIIAAVHYNRRKVYVRHVLTHAEYSRGAWKDECEE